LPPSVEKAISTIHEYKDRDPECNFPFFGRFSLYLLANIVGNIGIRFSTSN
jgi:hypothetical protein